jgi:hypothetical protein
MHNMDKTQEMTNRKIQISNKFRNGKFKITVCFRNQLCYQ